MNNEDRVKSEIDIEMYNRDTTKYCLWTH